MKNYSQIEITTFYDANYVNSCFLISLQVCLFFLYYISFLLIKKGILIKEDIY